MTVRKTYDLRITRGEDFVRRLRWKISGVFVVLDGFTARSQIREFRDSAGIAFSFDPVVAEDGTSWYIEISMTAAEAEALPIEQGYWDLEVVADDLKVTNLIRGKAFISEDVTR